MLLKLINWKYHQLITQIKWDDANKICPDLGNGWRLPTKEELNEKFKAKDEFRGFSNGKNKKDLYSVRTMRSI